MSERSREIGRKQSILARTRYTVAVFNKEFPTDDASLGQKYLQSYPGERAFHYNRWDMGNQQLRAILERVSERAS